MKKIKTLLIIWLFFDYLAQKNRLKRQPIFLFNYFLKAFAGVRFCTERKIQNIVSCLPYLISIAHFFDCVNMEKLYQISRSEA